MTGPRGTSTTNQKLPPVECRFVHLSSTYSASKPHVPHHCPVSLCHCVSLLTSSCAMCHPYSGDTCHPRTGPTVPIVLPITCHVSSPGAATSVVRPYGLYSQPATWHFTDCTVTHFFLPIWVFEQNAISFTYGARLTK
jgi:hypothetical protein